MSTLQVPTSGYGIPVPYREPFIRACIAGLPADEITSWLGLLDQVIEASVRPAAAITDQSANYPAASLMALGEIGVFGLQVPSRYGGLGYGDGIAALVVEQVARACSTTAAVLMFHYQVVRRTLLHGSEIRRADELAALAGGNLVGASAWTEANSGKGKTNLATRLEDRGSGRWILTGEKIFCTGLPGAGVVHVLANAQNADGLGGPTFVRVDAKDPAVHIPPAYPLLGLRGSGTGSIELRGLELRPEDLLGQIGAGRKLMQENHEVCLNPGLLALGTASAAFESAWLMFCQTTDGSSGRVRGERVRAALTWAEVQLEAAYLYGAHVVGLQRQAAAHVATGKFKLAVTTAAQNITSGLLEAVGSRGLVASYPLERHFRDSRAMSLMGPTSDLINDRVIDHMIASMNMGGQS
jgi:alkylation response protein AidB-like acyl-CoA dehydrogenase